MPTGIETCILTVPTGKETCTLTVPTEIQTYTLTMPTGIGTRTLTVPTGTETCTITVLVNKGCCRLVLQDVPSSLYACQQRLSPCPARYPLPLCAWLHVSAHPVSLHFVSESMLEQECDSLVSQVRKMQDPQSNMEQLKPSMRDLKTGGGGGS